VYTDSTTGNPNVVGITYSATPGDNNSGITAPGVGTVATTITPVCLNSLEPSGTTCGSPGVPNNAVHALQVNTVNTFFMRFLGIPTLTIKAEATATMNSVSQKWNVAIIEDATGSMSTIDSNCPGSPTEFQCALQGIQTLLKDTAPCQWGQTTCTNADANFHVSLWTFPNIITSDLPVANACSGATYTSPLPYQVMTLPTVGQSSYVPLTYSENGTKWSASYEVTYGASDADANGFVTDYYAPSSTSTGGLNANSSIVKAVGYGGQGGKVGCLPVSAAGIALNGATGGAGTSNSIVNTVDVGEGITYYAAVIYAAQSALTAEQALYPGSQNAMILLSDGQANTQWIYFPQGSLSQTPSANTSTKSTIVTGTGYPAGYDTLKSTPNTGAYVASHYTNPTSEATGTVSGMYPDFFDECQQAIIAGQYATKQGTTVYAVAYGSELSGCSSGSHAQDYTDVTLVATGSNLYGPLNAPLASVTAVTPCVTMENIASSLTTFYSDYLQSGSGVDSACQASSNSITQIGQIFTAISASFTTPRLIPNTAT